MRGLCSAGGGGRFGRGWRRCRCRVGRGDPWWEGLFKVWMGLRWEMMPIVVDIEL